jgi:integration host factor subunit beta
MTRSELIGALARRQSLTAKAASSVVESVFSGIEQALADGKRVELRGFGTFRARHYPGYAGRDPRTGEPVVVEPKVLPIFKAGKALSECFDDEGG